MAGKKGEVQNAEFLKKMRANTQRATQDVSQTLKNVGTLNPTLKARKVLQHIDIDEMMPAPEDWNRWPLLKDNQPGVTWSLKCQSMKRGLKHLSFYGDARMA